MAGAEEEEERRYLRDFRFPLFFFPAEIQTLSHIFIYSM